MGWVNRGIEERDDWNVLGVYKCAVNTLVQDLCSREGLSSCTGIICF